MIVGGIKMLKTEMRNPKSTHIDQMSTIEMVKLMSEENYVAVKAVEDACEDIAKAVDAISASMEQGGRLYYIGAGTSGRLGVLDASECPPTFGVPYDLVTGIIAGGYECLVKAGEGGEDKRENGIYDIESRVVAGDVVVGISAAGGAAYVVGAIERAKELGCVTVAVTSNDDSALAKTADICIYTDTGAEIITGSTRLKAGTAQKLVLNILTTASMVKTGKVYENLMINLSPTNEKLRRRVISIVKDICEVDEAKAVELLEANGWNIRASVNAYKQ